MLILGTCIKIFSITIYKLINLFNRRKIKWLYRLTKLVIFMFAETFFFTISCTTKYIFRHQLIDITLFIVLYVIKYWFLISLENRFKAGKVDRFWKWLQNNVSFIYGIRMVCNISNFALLRSTSLYMSQVREETLEIQRS